MAEKAIQYFTTAFKNTFLSTVHTFTQNNIFSYALSTLDNTTLGATCSYVNNIFFKTNTYTGNTTLASQPRLDGTYPSTLGQLG